MQIVADSVKKSTKTITDDSGKQVTVPKSFVNSTIYDAFVAALNK